MIRSICVSGNAILSLYMGPWICVDLVIVLGSAGCVESGNLWLFS